MAPLQRRPPGRVAQTVWPGAWVWPWRPPPSTIPQAVLLTLPLSLALPAPQQGGTMLGGGWGGEGRLRRAQERVQPHCCISNTLYNKIVTDSLFGRLPGILITILSPFPPCAPFLININFPLTSTSFLYVSSFPLFFHRHPIFSSITFFHILHGTA